MIRNIQDLEDDIGLAKRIIETVLYNDPDIVELIDNHTIDPETPEDLMYENLFPFIRIPGTQDKSGNYICYEVDDMSDISRNDRMKQQYIQFVVFVHRDLIKTKYGAPRHDMFGYTRTLKFQLITPEVAQDGLFDNRYERLSLNRQDRKIVRENVGN